MPSRRPHTKSRLGCLTCKQRRVRCDQVRPRCGNCARLEKACAYPNVLIVDSSHRGPPADSAVDEPGIGTGEPLSTISHEAVRDLDLLHYYTTQTSLTLADEPRKQEVWRLKVPQHAFSNRFLLHGLLALAALHRSQDCDLARRTSYIEQARKHYSQALLHYTPAIKDVNQANCHALFAFSMLIGAASYALLQHTPNDQAPETLIDSVIEAFDLLHGASLVARKAQSWLKQGDLSLLMDLDQTSTPAASDLIYDWGPRLGLEAVLGHLQRPTLSDASEMNPSDSTQAEKDAAYTASINHLIAVLPPSTSARPSRDLVLAWPVMAGEPYVMLLKAKDPTALMILNHYGTAIHYLSNVWWMKSIGGRIHRAISLSIDPEWRAYLTMSSWQVTKGSMPLRTA